jgi:hypothetical protein
LVARWGFFAVRLKSTPLNYDLKGPLSITSITGE